MHNHYTILATVTMFPLIILSSLLFMILLKGKSKRLRLLPFVIVAALIFFGEIAKQIYSFNQPDGYNLTHLPLYICSIFIVSLPVAVIFKQGGKVANFAWAVSLTTALMMTIGVLAVPEVIIGPATEAVFTNQATFLNFHSFFFHYLLVFFLVMAIILKPTHVQLVTVLKSSVVYLVYMTVVAIMTQVTQVDFALMLDTPIAAINNLGNISMWLKYPVVILIYGVIYLVAGILVKFLTSQKPSQAKLSTASQGTI